MRLFRRFLRSVFVAVVFLGVVVLAVAYILLPSLLEGAVARDLQGRLGLDEPPAVELRGDPASMLTGNFEGGRVVLPGTDLGSVRPERVTIELAPFELDVWGSLASGELQTRQPLSGTLRAELSEAEVERIAVSEVVDFPVRGVDLEVGRALVYSEVRALGQPVPVSAVGNVTAQDGALVFEPGDIEAFGTPVPQWLTRQLLQGTSFVYPVGGLPLGAVISGAGVHKDRLVLTGEIQSVQVSA